jgi:hypothetical protein
MNSNLISSFGKPSQIKPFPRCCKYPFGEYIVESPERNLSEILKLLASINLDLKITEKLGKIGNVKKSKKSAT